MFSHAPAVLEARLGAVHSLIWSHAARFRCANILPREGMSSLHLCQLVRDPIEIAGHSKERTFHVFIRQPARSFIKHIADPRHDICSAPNLTRKIITVFLFILLRPLSACTFCPLSVNIAEHKQITGCIKRKAVWARSCDLGYLLLNFRISIQNINHALAANSFIVSFALYGYIIFLLVLSPDSMLLCTCPLAGLSGCAGPVGVAAPIGPIFFYNLFLFSRYLKMIVMICLIIFESSSGSSLAMIAFNSSICSPLKTIL